MSGRSEQMKLIRRLKKAGFTVDRTGSGHWRVQNPEREGTVILSFSPNTTAKHKALKQLASIGYEE